MPSQVELIALRRANGSLDVRPGITGLAQVNGFRGETEKLEAMEGRVHYDLEYLRHWSVMLDLKILLRTVMMLVRDKNAY